MKQQIKDAIKYIKKQNIKGCITGSTLLGYFPDQDIDIFIYNTNSFRNFLNTLINDKLFTIMGKEEEWKLNRFMYEDPEWKKHKLITIKFMYNTIIPINIILKRDCTNIFSVLSTFDLDIICKGYDIETKQTLDLSQNLPKKRVAWNRWNTKYYNTGIWEIGNILRQLERCFKYSKRGYNTDDVVLKYIKLIDGIQAEYNLFNSPIFEEQLKRAKNNTKIVKKICQVWLKTHEIEDKQLNTIRQLIKEI